MSDNTEISKSDSGIEDKNNESSVTLLEVLELQKELEEESAAVLGGSDEKECTYEKGYIKRQALYSCLTCSPEGKAGVCLACSYQCHENHELIELYTKRNFRCDCPTERIPNKKCTFINPQKNNSLMSSSSSSSASSSSSNNDNKKLPENKDNLYNQNFSGVYCICKRPYPDPDDPIQDEMIQCVICEDWYHTRHLDSSNTIPKSDSYSEITCGNCMQKYDFLKDYTGYASNKCEIIDEENNTSGIEDISVTSEGEDDKLKSELDKSISDIMSISSKNSSEDDKMNLTASGSVDSSTDDEPLNKKIRFDEELFSETCKRSIGKSFYKKGGVFWTGDWRKNLCKCSICMRMYEKLKIEYLLDKEDTVQFYEENGLKRANEINDDEKILRALSSMDRVKQIEAITEYNRMKNKLTEFLRTFVVSQKVVTEADIHGFFQEMKNEKNKNLGVPHFCR